MKKTTHFHLYFKRFSERAILVEWPGQIDEKILEDVLSFKKAILQNHNKQIVQVISAYHSILITYRATIDNFNSEVSRLKAVYVQRKYSEQNLQKRWRIPVCYDAQFGLDLAEISKTKNRSKSEIIKRHSEAIYTVYFIGFLPGFLYLGGLDEQLYVPRKAQPRQRIEKGAVAIGGSQTGIYPNASPAGWNVIGNCPLELFDATQNPPCFAKAGDQVQFCQIGLEQHHKISEAIKKGTYNLEFETIDD